MRLLNVRVRVCSHFEVFFRPHSECDFITSALDYLCYSVCFVLCLFTFSLHCAYSEYTVYTFASFFVYVHV